VTLDRTPDVAYACTTGLAELERVANGQRLLPDVYLNAAGTGISPAFRDYALPLIGDPLPQHARLEGVPLPRA
jgi:ATP-dependent phosphofructokinase / diphosphate-dependent phosphofructokinase